MAKPQYRSRVACKFKCLNLGRGPKVSLNLGHQACGLVPCWLSLKAQTVFCVRLDCVVSSGSSVV